jgi:ribose transport system substrate-binding protein
MSTIAFWIAQQVLAGKKVPNVVNVPLLAIQADTLDAWLAVTPEGTAASPRYSKDDAVALIDATVAGKKVSELPQPKLPQ